MRALVFTRNEFKYALSKALAPVSSSSALNLGPLKLKDIDPLSKPANEGWERILPRLSGICGSDLSTLSGKTSRYFEPLVSFPFVMGHEIVANNEKGERVVVDAVLGHAARGLKPPHSPSGPESNSHPDTSLEIKDYDYLISGELPPGIQTGNCEATGGGWGKELLAHSSQLHNVPVDFSDEAAVMVEPVASGIHAALKAKALAGDLAVVIGGGTIGLAVTAALRKYTPVEKILVAAKYSTQQKLALEMGADEAVAPDEIVRLTRRFAGCKMTGNFLSGGADVAIDAVGSAGSIKTGMQLVRPRGRLIACGMPGTSMLDLAPLWHREVELTGAYAYGMELDLEKPVHTFELAFELVKSAGFENLVSEFYTLEQYKDAINHAWEAGSRGDFKIVFDFRT